jgi:nitroreductase
MNQPTIMSIDVLRHAAESARLAPSVHNTQPWKFVLTGDSMEIYADRRRQLAVLDPTGRQLLISVGCAVFNARVALAAAGFDAIVRYFPDEDQPNLVTRLSLPQQRTEWNPLTHYADCLSRRQTNRRRFADDDVPAEVVYNLTQAAAAEGAQLTKVRHLDHRLAVARLTQQADAEENTNPAYRAELRQWTSDDPIRADGVPAMAVPHVTGRAHDDIPIRDFDTRGIGWLPTETRSSVNQCLLILGTTADDQVSWVRAGEALEHLWLEATRAGFVASLFTQVIEVPYTRERLRSELELTMHPHVLLRVGHASQTASSKRRPLDELLTYRRAEGSR